MVVKHKKNSLGRASFPHLLLVLAALAAAPAAWAQNGIPSDCGSLENGYGPFDYTNPMHKQERLPVVHRFHFNSDVYELRSGLTAVSPVGDLDYTLRAFPNHHLALDAMARLHRQEGVSRFPGESYSLECWFERARRFQPADGMVSMIYGIHLFHSNRFEDAEEPLRRAVELMPQSVVAHYNLGLLYVRLENYAAAREHAQKAYGMGAQLPGLRDQLEEAGEWLAAQ